MIEGGSQNMHAFEDPGPIGLQDLNSDHYVEVMCQNLLRNEHDLG